ncbi:hypothetical protein IRA69_05240 [Campylobacter hepaticus]|uniref:MetQ/NlpA family ABC transporter substrate-binding protein n=1 Tax=Campylobacter hepaticus TaxID=1813019 RepID=UPI0018C00785|nr:MetQ/NlpA family ABC transporter substrate-binding protein [Campylobacter hepaticus]MDX2330702.1 MetQ/NlpA family ABC transporter substrate-binding protein [Campylobacter hepaticus]MDX2371318.1 MetQ/NlpA family ABC transporter substrate-binding protein [Campylobacter hepaticus]MDX2396567.1 MetQ/NlpA family ABC transporter substrate-binding protein [Campylobacter hepaticus]MDX5508476.1 MetQ/NlpA family ABC transporter substrate-binding protein [Campylobacter hepaticus]QOW63441.1 hypothetical
MTVFTKAFCIATLFNTFIWENEEIKISIPNNPTDESHAQKINTQLAKSLKDTDYTLINSNFAILTGLNPIKDGLYIENEYNRNIITVKQGNEELPKIKALTKTLQSNKVKNLSKKNQGTLIPTF